VFEHWASWDWDRVTAEAQRYEPAIAEFHPASLEEMRGIAEGAGARFEDILALNVRTEVMFAGRNRERSVPIPVECSAFAAVGRRPVEHTLLGQNWDWLLHARDTVVILDIADPQVGRLMTVVEAGLLAKAGLNSAGLGLVTNALVTDADLGEPGMPYHVLLRRILWCATVDEAVALIRGVPRASSANFLVADASGHAVDVEARPGGPSSISLLEPEDDLIAHTNHFVMDPSPHADVTIELAPESPARRARLLEALGSTPRPRTMGTIGQVLRAHGDPGASVCAHPDPERHPLERSATIASIVIDLDDRALEVVPGLPCEGRPRQRFDLMGSTGV
jgi:isopenicillin-N N-acyltransferase-like protein